MLRGLKLGPASASSQSGIRNRANADNVLVEDCRLRGGGGQDVTVVKLGESSNNASNVTFRNCDIECNLGTWNDISIRENAWAGGAHIENVTFEGCHIGVSNGVRSGSPRAGLEAWTNDGGVAITHGWRNLRLINNVFEAADAFTIDLPDTWRIGDRTVRGGPALVSGNLIKGGGADTSAGYGYSICIESPQGVIVENNTIWRASNNTIGTAPDVYNPDPPIFRNNTIDLTVDNGITPSAAYIYVRGDRPQFIDNRIISPGGQAIFKIENTNGAVITGNDITTGGSTVWKLWDATITNLTRTPNTIH